MGVQFVNKRVLTITRELTVGDLQQLVAGLAASQRISVAIHRGYSDPRESTPDSVELTINNPQPAGHGHLPVYPEGVR
jgi:hypothetical protein